MPAPPPPEHTKWKPGQSGNPKGRPPKAKVWEDALIAAIARKASGEPDILLKLADALIEKVRTGDVGAIKEFGDRMDGKVPQAIVGDANYAPVTVRTIVTGVQRAEDIVDDNSVIELPTLPGLKLEE